MSQKHKETAFLNLDSYAHTVDVNFFVGMKVSFYAFLLLFLFIVIAVFSLPFFCIFFSPPADTRQILSVVSQLLQRCNIKKKNTFNWTKYFRVERLSEY